MIGDLTICEAGSKPLSPADCLARLSRLICKKWMIILGIIEFLATHELRTEIAEKGHSATRLVANRELIAVIEGKPPKGIRNHIFFFISTMLMVYRLSKVYKPNLPTN